MDKPAMEYRENVSHLLSISVEHNAGQSDEIEALRAALERFRRAKGACFCIHIPGANVDHTSACRQATAALARHGHPMMTEGWAWISDGRRRHYFIDGKSLCRKHQPKERISFDWSDPGEVDVYDCIPCRGAFSKRRRVE